MILVVGDIGSGKKKFTQEKLVGCENCSNVFFATQYIKENFTLENSEKVKQLTINKACEGGFDIVILDELGCQVLPTSKCDRMIIETNGEVGQEIAKIALEVYFINNGVAKKIKP